MRIATLLLLALLPLGVLASSSVIANPEDAAVVLPITDPTIPQEFFGSLNGFPHTFEFALAEDTPLLVAISVQDSEMQQNDVSILLVRQEQRGVTEVGRTNVKEETWHAAWDSLLAESFRFGGELESTLEPGIYTLEVSSPNNDGNYRLALGGEPPSRSYFENLQTLFAVKKAYGSPWYTLLASPLVYSIVILVGLVSLLIGVRIRKKNNA